MDSDAISFGRCSQVAGSAETAHGKAPPVTKCRCVEDALRSFRFRCVRYEDVPNLFCRILIWAGSSVESQAASGRIHRAVQLHRDLAAAASTVHQNKLRAESVVDQIRMIRDMGPALGGVNRHSTPTSFYFRVTITATISDPRNACIPLCL